MREAKVSLKVPLQVLERSLGKTDEGLGITPECNSGARCKRTANMQEKIQIKQYL